MVERRCTRRPLCQVLSALLLGAAALPAWAQTGAYPVKPIRLVVPFAPGGGADLVARAVAAPLAKRLGQPIVVDNKPGGGATVGADFVAKAPADGYTVLYTTPGPQMTNPFLMGKLPYDPVADLSPVGQVAVVPNVLVVNSKTVPAKTLKDFIAYARANPGKLDYASAGMGSSSHLSGELFKHRAKVHLVHIAYRGTGPALQDLLAGNVTMAIDSLAVYRPHIESGALVALGVSMPERSALLPQIPTIAEVLPGFESSPINYLSARSGTPKEVITRLNQALNEVLATPELLAYFAANGVVAKGGTPEEMAAVVQREATKWREIIKISGAKIE